MTKTAHRQLWLTFAQREILAARPDLSGKLDWDTLLHLYYSGMTAEDAAKRYLARIPQEK